MTDEPTRIEAASWEKIYRATRDLAIGAGPIKERLDSALHRIGLLNFDPDEDLGDLVADPLVSQMQTMFTTIRSHPTDTDPIAVYVNSLTPIEAQQAATLLFDVFADLAEYSEW
ncbi:MAG: hypothetical protein GYB64_20475 [Chloroflexi bacterium]|nr:hypothetical protein [Chloroflexota bacterium]